MPTTNRGYATPATGTLSGTWGSAALNPNFDLIDSNLGAVSSVSLSSSNVVLNAAQYACGTIRLSGTLSANVTVTFPSVAGWWVIDNRTVGNFYVLLTCGGGENIAVQQGVATDIFTDGTNTRFRNLGRIGEYWDYIGSTVPPWVTACTVPPYLACDGSSFSAVTYPHLNAILGGTTLPDSRGRGRFALDGGTSRITTAGSGIDGATRLSAGGAQNVSVLQANLPSVDFVVDIPSGQGSHIHTGEVALSRSGIAYQSGGFAAFQSVTSPTTTLTIDANTLPALAGTAASGGSGTAVNKMPPAYIGGITMIRAA